MNNDDTIISTNNFEITLANFRSEFMLIWLPIKSHAINFRIFRHNVLFLFSTHFSIFQPPIRGDFTKQF